MREEQNKIKEQHYGTSVSQSEELVKLGLDPATADLCYIRETWYDYETDTEMEGWSPYPVFDDAQDEDEPFVPETMPAWSLSALLGVIPSVNENTYTINGCLDGGILLTFDEATNVACQERYPIDAAFEMVKWLLEIDVIKHV